MYWNDRCRCTSVLSTAARKHSSASSPLGVRFDDGTRHRVELELPPEALKEASGEELSQRSPSAA